MKCVVTGSIGFLASHLINRLNKEGCDVIGWDILTGQDVCDNSLNSVDIEAIFHLACPVNPANYKEVAVPTMLASSVGTYNMLELARQNQAKFLYVSSSEVYGESSFLPFKEDDPGIISTTNSRAYYGESKRFGEMQTMVYHNFLGLDARIVRPFNIYGPGMRWDDTRVIPSFFRNKKEGKHLIVNDGGQSTRTFCYITDFIEGIMKAMFLPNTNGRVFNLGTEEKVTIKELAGLISDKIEIVDYTRIGEQRHRVPDISKAWTVLNWYQTVSLKDGLELTWKSYQ